MPEPLRVLNAVGRERWRAFVQSLKTDSSLPVPGELLNNEETSLEVMSDHPLPAGPFDSKFTLAQALLPTIEAIEETRLPESEWPGVWDALALVYFDEICPRNDGKRRVGEIERFVYNGHYTRNFKHRVAGNLILFRSFKEHSLLFLWGSPRTLSDYEIQICSRPAWLGAPAVGDAMFCMYWNPKTKRPKVGGMSSSKSESSRTWRITK